MQTRRFSWMTAALVASMTSWGAGANVIDRKSAMICAEAINLPTFWRVDPKAKVANSRRPDGSERLSRITNVSTEGGKLVMQGSDGGFGWTVSVDVTSGKMVLTGGSETGYLVFGECTTP